MAAESLGDSPTHRSRKSATSKVGFLLTEVDLESFTSERPLQSTQGKELSLSGPPASSISQLSDKARQDSNSALPLVNVYCVEDVDPPLEVLTDGSVAAPLPQNLPMDSVMKNIVRNLDFKEHARSVWFKDFKSPPSRAVISDTFWYCICWYFKSGQHPKLEKRLMDRISANFVALFSSIPASRKDFFFRCYADAVAQAVLYAMFLAYPKSRVRFTETFRKDLIIRISHWTTGVCPEFVKATHWKLDLGGGDVLQNTASAPSTLAGGPGAASTSMALQTVLSPDALSGQRASLAHRAPRPPRTLRYSPLVARFLKSRRYSSVNLVRETRMSMTQAEERARLMDLKHAMLVERASAARHHCDEKVSEYNELLAQSRYQDHQREQQAQQAKKRLEIRRKEVLRSDPHEYANYLVSLHLLQQGLGQSA